MSDRDQSAENERVVLDAINDMQEILDKRLKPTVLASKLPSRSKTMREIGVIQKALLRLRRKVKEDWQSLEKVEESWTKFFEVAEQMENEAEENQEGGPEQRL